MTMTILTSECVSGSRTVLLVVSFTKVVFWWSDFDSANIAKVGV